MLKRYLTIGLLAALLNLAGLMPARANTSSGTGAGDAARIREKIKELGTGTSATVTVSLKDGSVVKGHVIEADGSAFTVAGDEGREQSIEYSQVKKVKGRNFSTGVKIAIGLAVGIGVLAIAILANRKVCRNSLCK